VSKAQGGFVPPAYPFDRLSEIAAIADRHEGGMVDLSVGDPNDETPRSVVDALFAPDTTRQYPSGAGSEELRHAASAWIARRFGIDVEGLALAVCIGTKELVAGIPHWLRLRCPERDTVLYPAISYPTYEMGATLASCRAVPIATRADGTLDLASIAEQDVSRALCLWLNSPSNPTGKLDDLGAAAAFGRAHGVPVFSDECYAEFTWDGPPRTILSHGTSGVVALHSISKRSNAAGLRLGFYAGDDALVHYLSELRRHAGFMVPGPIQRAGAVALEDDAHVLIQRERYATRLGRFVEILAAIGITTELPAGGFYLWVRAPGSLQESSDNAATDGDNPGWAFARYLARFGGVLVSPGEFYGPGGDGYVRIALVEPIERLELVARRFAANKATEALRALSTES